MIKIILIKAKWNAFVQRRMSCFERDDVADTEDSELSSSFPSEHSEYLHQ